MDSFHHGIRPPFQFGLLHIRIPDFTVTSDDSSLTLGAALIRVHVSKYPVRLTFLDNAGTALTGEPASGGAATVGAQRKLVLSLGNNEHLYGTGERGLPLDKHGLAFSSYNTQVYGYDDSLPTMGINIPVVLSSAGYCLYIDNTWPGFIDCGKTNWNNFTYRAYGGELTYYVIAAKTIPAQLERYTWLTGRAPMPPRWTMGFIQSKYGYKNEGELRAVVDSLRINRYPADGVVLDLYWFSKMGDITWNPVNFPNHDQLINDLLARGIKTLVISEPYITTQSANYGPATGIGVLAKTSTGAPYLVNNWWSCNCSTGLLDITKPVARSWWWQKNAEYMGTNVAGFWTDLGEPEKHPEDMVHDLGTAFKIHNIYNLLWARTMFEGLAKFRPNERIVNLTRSGFAGIQRYGVTTWSGDVAKSFTSFAAQMPILLTMGLSGVGFHNSDMGGFCCGQDNEELYVRWLQFGTFTPMMRAHGTSKTEPWSYSPRADSISRNFINLRYRMLPYNYTLAHENTVSGMPLARPLFFLDPENPGLAGESRSYLWGSNLLVHPVVQAGQVNVTVDLPADSGDGWIDFWSDHGYGQDVSVTISCPLERIPVFVRGGSVIPMQSLMQYSDEHPVDTLWLQSYPVPESPGKERLFLLYEDDGKSLDYQTGGFARTPLTLEVEGDSTVAFSIHSGIGPTVGTYANQPQHRVWISQYHRVGSAPARVRINGTLVARLNSMNGLLTTNGQGWYFDINAGILSVKAEGDPASQYQIAAESLMVGRLTGLRETATPEKFGLQQNYPNPFNPRTMIQYSVPSRSHVTLTVYDQLGKEIKTLVDGTQAEGAHTAEWNADDVSSGAYYYRLEVQDATNRLSETRKLMLVR